MNKFNDILITEERYKDLLDTEEKFFALINYGVNNWEWFDDAMDAYRNNKDE